MADMNLIQAADEVRKMLRGFKAIDMVAAALEQAGSVQNAVKEAEKQLVDMRKQVADASATVEASKYEVIIAKDEARKVKADASAKADEKLTKTADKIATMLADADAAVAAANDKVATSEARLVEINDGIRNATIELEAIEKKIAAAKKQVATILG
jgi:chromosome segregation ATPase